MEIPWTLYVRVFVVPLVFIAIMLIAARVISTYIFRDNFRGD